MFLADAPLAGVRLTWTVYSVVFNMVVEYGSVNEKLIKPTSHTLHTHSTREEQTPFISEENRKTSKPVSKQCPHCFPLLLISSCSRSPLI